MRSGIQSFTNHSVRAAEHAATWVQSMAGMYKAGTAPECMTDVASERRRLHHVAVHAFRSRIESGAIGALNDWLSDGEDVLTQLGMVQKTRHEVDKMQTEVESLFTRKMQYDDKLAENALNKKLAAAKERLAAACLLYDGSRRGVERSLHFLLQQRAKLFHDVTRCMMEAEHSLFHVWIDQTADFVRDYPYSASPPPDAVLAEDPFHAARMAEHREDATSAVLNMAAFKASDADTEGEQVRALRRTVEENKSLTENAIATATTEMNGAKETANATSPSDEHDKGALESVVKVKEDAATNGNTGMSQVLSPTTGRPYELATSISVRSPLSPIVQVNIRHQGKVAAAAAVESSTPAQPPDDSAQPVSSSDNSSSPDDVFQSPEQLSASDPTPPSQNGDHHQRIAPPPSASPAATPLSATHTPTIPVAHRSYDEVVAVANAQVALAASFNLPAKPLPARPPSVPLHPVLWDAVPLSAIRGSIWGRVACEVELDEKNDEIREKFAMPDDVAPVFEQAFRTDQPLHAFIEEQMMERKEGEERQAMVRKQPDTSLYGASPSTRNNYSSSRSRGESDKFADMRSVDGSVFPAPHVASSSTPFPAHPYPCFTAKQWYRAHLVVTHTLYPLTPIDALRAIYTADDHILTPQRVSALMRIMPNAEQRTAILHAHADHPNASSPLEQLLLYLSLETSPSLATRLAVLAFHSEFTPLCCQLEETLSTLENCCLEVKRSANLRVLLSLALSCGNWANLSWNIQPAYGFTLDSLPMLLIHMTSPSHSHSSLLDMLVYILHRHFPHLDMSSFNNILHAFPHLTASLHIDEPLFLMQLRHVVEQADMLKRAIEEDEYEKQMRPVTSTEVAVAQAQAQGSASSTTPTLPFPPSAFPPHVPRFNDYVQSRTQSLLLKYDTVRAELVDLCRFLCVRPIATPGHTNTTHTSAQQTQQQPHAQDSDSHATYTRKQSSAAQHTGATIGGLADLPPDASSPSSTAAFSASASSNSLPSSAAASSATASTSSVLTQPAATTARYDWRGALRILHTFLQDFTRASNDYMVATKLNKARVITNNNDAQSISRAPAPSD